MKRQPADSKQCAKCGAIKPRATGFYRYRKDLYGRGDADGYRNRCIECTKADNAAYKKANAAAIAAYMRDVRARAKEERERSRKPKGS